MASMTPLKAIRAKCMDCMCEQPKEIKLCPITDCSLYPFRFGKNPNIKREYTDEQRNAVRDRFHKKFPETKESISASAQEYTDMFGILGDEDPFVNYGENA